MQSVLKINRKRCKNVAVTVTNTKQFRSCTRLNFFLLCELGSTSRHLFIWKGFSLYFSHQFGFQCNIINITEDNGYVVFTVNEIFTDHLGNRGGEGESQRGLNTKRPTKSSLIKKKKYSLIYKEIQMWSGAKSYMRKRFLIYEEMSKYSARYEEAVSHIRLCTINSLVGALHPILSEFPYTIWGKFSFIFYQCTGWQVEAKHCRGCWRGGVQTTENKIHWPRWCHPSRL